MRWVFNRRFTQICAGYWGRGKEGFKFKFKSKFKYTLARLWGRDGSLC